MLTYDIAVLGGGPAGMAAALSARDAGKSVVLIERSEALGGVMSQCIHNGFGRDTFHEDLTGPEFALRFRRMVEAAGIDVRLSATVLSVSPNKTVAVLSARGQERIAARAVISALGSREYSAGYLGINGTRPAAGVLTAGAAQKRVNCYGERIGDTAVIYGSNDPGLVMARRLVTEGTRVLAVLEPKPYSYGSLLNIGHCLNDYRIPIRYRTAITRVTGEKRLTGIYTARVDAKRQCILTTEQYVPCDTLLLSAGMHPESELLSAIGAGINLLTGGPIVDEFYQTTLPGVFSCGNALHVHNTADRACMEGGVAGRSAALYTEGGLNASPVVPVASGKNIAAVLPNVVHTGADGSVTLLLRMRALCRDKTVTVYSGDRAVKRCKKLAMAPGEAVPIEVKRSLLRDKVTVEVE